MKHKIIEITASITSLFTHWKKIVALAARRTKFETTSYKLVKLHKETL